MTKPTITQSQKRSKDSLGSLFIPESRTQSDFIFLKSSSDVGVERNGGRNGARLAPQSFLSYFKKMNKTASLEKKRFSEHEVASAKEEREDFSLAQNAQSLRIKAALDQHPEASVCHLGGGHDHIYPLLKALGQKHKKVIVINVDAHADTRTDEEFHSGTPFRQFANEFKGDFFLYQVGLLQLANSLSTLGPLYRGTSKILWRTELSKPELLGNFFNEIRPHVDAESVVIFSLDADALSGQEIPGVSAVNGNGLSRAELEMVWEQYQKLPMKHAPIIGIYELNPVYDTLSMLSMRTLGTFVFELL